MKRKDSEENLNGPNHPAYVFFILMFANLFENFNHFLRDIIEYFSNQFGIANLPQPQQIAGDQQQDNQEEDQQPIQVEGQQEEQVNEEEDQQPVQVKGQEEEDQQPVQVKGQEDEQELIQNEKDEAAGTEENNESDAQHINPPANSPTDSNPQATNENEIITAPQDVGPVGNMNALAGINDA